jgi:hypothetical protein
MKKKLTAILFILCVLSSTSNAIGPDSNSLGIGPDGYPDEVVAFC